MNEQWLKFYRPSQTLNWSPRADEDAQQRLGSWITSEDLPQLSDRQERSLGLLGFCCDEGVSRNNGRRGAAKGPEAIRKHLPNLPSHQQRHIFDCGDIVCTSPDLESSQEALKQAVFSMHQKNMLSCLLGGGHETAWGHFQGLHLAHPQKNIGIINFDAHFDIRPVQKNVGHSGTPFLQISELLEKESKPFSYMCLGVQESSNTLNLFEKANQLNIASVLADDIDALPLDQVTSFIQNCDGIYLSICLDVFNSAHAPGVSAPQPFGISTQSFNRIFSHILSCSNILGIDIVELNPQFDQQETTAKLASQILRKIFDHNQII